MPCFYAVHEHETAASHDRVFLSGTILTSPPDIIAEEPSGRRVPGCDPRRSYRRRLAKSNQPISAVVMNAEAALWLLLAEPTDTETVRQFARLYRHGRNADRGHR